MPFGRVASAVAPHLPLRSRWRAKSLRSAVESGGRLFRALARAGPPNVRVFRTMFRISEHCCVFLNISKWGSDRFREQMSVFSGQCRENRDTSKM